MYFVGIDFGHGETTASCYNTEKGKVERLHILDGNDDESNKVESAVCRNKETGEWQFAKDIQDYASPDFTLHFKAPMNEISKKNKEAFGKFIKLVFDHILENHKSVLKYDPETGEKNFELYAACPSGWDKDGSDQIKAYKDFMSSIIPVDWIIKESDAAYFKFKEETKRFGSSTVLVIDVGSSTIDFTAYGEDGFSSLSDGKKHGASAVERSIFKHFDSNDRDFQNAKQEALPICQKDHKNWDDAVVHYIKNRKEYYYTKELNVMRLDLSNKMICLPNISKSRVFDDITVPKEQLEDDILSSYRQTLLDDIRGVKEQIGKIEVVILTGGASRMPWLQQLVRDIFPDPVVYWRDPEPSYVVSDGIAYYAHAVYELKQKVLKVIEDFEKKYDDATLAKMLFTQFNNSLRENQLPKIKEICDRFDKGELKYNSKDMEAIGAPADPKYDGRSCTAAFFYAMIVHNQNIIKDASGEISRDVNSNMNAALKADIVSNLKNAFNDALHFVPDVDINPSVNFDLSDISINSEWDINKIIDMTKSIFEDLFNYGDIYKDRTSEGQRRRFSVPFYKEQEAANVNLPDELMQKAVKSLKDSIHAELTVEKMVRKCIFSIY